MELSRYIGFKIDELRELLDKQGLEYEILEVWDNKKTKLGDDIRVIKIINEEKIKIFVSYF